MKKGIRGFPYHCFVRIFTINVYHIYGFKMLILVTEKKPNIYKKIRKPPIILLSELIRATVFLPHSLKRALYIQYTK